MIEEKIFKIDVEKENEGERIDSFLASRISERSRSFFQKLLDEGMVLVNGSVCGSKKYKVKALDIIEVEMPEAKEPDIIPENIALDIVYEDDDVLVINKPAGMVVHPAAGNYTGTLVNAIMHHCGDRLSSINGVIRPGIVHRIDKDTSGLLMVAKNDAAHNSLAQQLAEHSITRKYVAIVWDNLKENDGIVDAPIGRHPKDRKKQSVMYDDTGKRAVTHWKVLERFGSFTLVECQLETGRTHQIRVHMAYIKHPLLGDSVYGPAKSAAGAKRQMLHAKTLGFVHPSTGKYIEFDSQLPEDFSEVLNKLGKQNEQN